MGPKSISVDKATEIEGCRLEVAPLFCLQWNVHSLTHRCSFLGNRGEEFAKIILLQVLKDAIHTTGAEESDEIKASL